MKRHCPTCRFRYLGDCANEELVGTSAEPLEGAPQTKKGEAILGWLAESAYSVADSTDEVPGDMGIRAAAGPCPGWGRR